MWEAVWILLDGSESSRGYCSIWHSLQMNGMRVPMTVIDQLVRELDSAEVQETKAHPLKRRTYQNAGPNHFWHYDGHDKFRPYGFPTHGCIDGWGIWRVIGDNNDNCKVMGPTAKRRGRLQGDGADCKATRLIARRRGWLQGEEAGCKAMGLIARRWAC